MRNYLLAVHFALSLGLAILGSVLLARGEMVEWRLSEGGNGHFYEVVWFNEDLPRSWDRAWAQAFDRGGYLATVTSAEENAFVVQLISDPVYWSHGGIFWEGPWIGGYQHEGGTEPRGGWRWATGEAMTYRNWNSGQPDNYPSGPYHQQDRIHYWDFGAETFEELVPMWDDAVGLATYVPSYVVEYDDLVRVDIFLKSRRRLLPGSVNIRGIASAFGGVRFVRVRVNSNHARRATGTTRWSIETELRRGKNVVRAIATSRDGRVSKAVTMLLRCRSPRR